MKPEDIFEALQNRQLEKSTLMENSLAQYHVDQVHAQRAEELLEIESFGLKCFGRPAAKILSQIKSKAGWKTVQSLSQQ